ncbi:MAG: AMP-binding protein [Burkholderiaceae bacterium]|nr:AMP-binding protein [Burkholderiaceae bacterium]
MKDFADAAVMVEQRADGSMILRSPQALQQPGTLGQALDRAAARAPGTIFLAERAGDGWREVSYGQARRLVRALAASLLGLGASVERPLMILSDNSVDVGLLTLAAHYVGIAVVHTTSAYATQARDFDRLQAIVASTRPAVVYAVGAAQYGRALRELVPADARVVVSAVQDAAPDWLLFDTLTRSDSTAPEVDREAAQVHADTPARLLYTSGSTSAPKGVVQTHGMLAGNAQARAQLWLFLDREPPVFLDWLPWSHGFGSSQNFTMALWHAGSFYIDDGRPLPAQIERTVENLRMVRPTVFFTVPATYQILLPFLERDEALAQTFFSRMRALFYAGADMPRTLWAAYETLAARHTGRHPFFTSSWGMTEVMAATYVHFPIEQAGNIGLPMPGVEIKLAPVDDKLELRVRGWGTTTGYWKQPELNVAVFDEEGFFKTGDAGCLMDPRRPEAGLAYDGRIGENFKLSSGRWVPVGRLRLKTISAGAPAVLDAVIAGHGQDDASVLVFLDLEGARSLAPELAGLTLAQLAEHPRVRTHLREMLRSLARRGDGLPVIRRAIALAGAPVQGEEVGEKGYINQRAVLKRRDAEAQALYRGPYEARVIRAEESDE